MPDDVAKIHGDGPIGSSEILWRIKFINFSFIM